MSFAWAWCFALLPLPWLLRRFAKPAEDGAALRVPNLPARTTPAAARTATAGWLAALAWLLLVIAAARPQLPDAARAQPASGRDLMLAFDVSASMATADLSVAGRATARLAAARHFADAFLARRAGDRVGLIVFGSQAYLHTPLTYDLEAVRAALATADVGLAGRETALGDAVALAVRQLQDSPARERVLVLLSDGANTAGSLTPERAGWLARRAALRIHAVGIGGAQPGSGLDAATLKDIAERSEGLYVRATDSAALADFWQRLDAIEPGAQAMPPLRQARELYAWPLGLALAIAAVLLLARGRKATP